MIINCLAVRRFGSAFVAVVKAAKYKKGSLQRRNGSDSCDQQTVSFSFVETLKTFKTELTRSIPKVCKLRIGRFSYLDKTSFPPK